MCVQWCCFSDLNINTVIEFRTKNVNVDKYERRVCSADLSLTGTIMVTFRCRMYKTMLIG